MIAKAGAFVKRDFAIAASYRITFIESFVMLLFGLVSMDFVARLVDEGAPPALAPYGNDYFGYALIGVSTALFAQAVAGQFAGVVRGAQVTGTLEVLVGSRTSLPAFLAYSSVYGLSFTLVRTVAALLIGSVVLGAGLQATEIPLAALVLVLTIAIFAGVGIFAAAFVVWFKQPEPFTSALMTLSLLLSGVLYPTSVLPDWLEKIAPLLPLTHTMSALRASLLEGATDSSVTSDLIVLGGLALLLPLSLVAFDFAVARVKAAGSLSHY